MLEYKQAFFNHTAAVSPAEEFFENYVLERTTTIDSFGGLNPKLVIAYLFAWMTTAVVLCKGVKLMGKVAYFTSTVPYLIIIALFVRSVTLDGAIEGMNYYILKPDFSTVWDLSAWRAAATHVSFSLSIGFGGILSLASYNPKEHNCYKDALIITTADAAMSLFGGTAVFSVLGFMSKQLNLPIDQVVQSGTGLAFVAYPEALSRMPISWLWALLFFFMIWTLGVSSQFGYAECICTAFCDQFEVLRRNQAKTVFGVCACLYLCYKNYLADLRSMVGPPMTKLGAIFGPTGIYISFVWRFICPLQAFVIFIFALVTQINYDMSYGKGNRLYVFPKWSIMLGWTLSLLPLLWLPVFFVYRAFTFRQANKSLKEMCHLQPEWPSYTEKDRKPVDSPDFSFISRKRNQKVYEVENGFSNGFSTIDTTHAFYRKDKNIQKFKTFECEFCWSTYEPPTYGPRCPPTAEKGSTCQELYGVYYCCKN
uniref:Sodium-and chloride-dependent glycine transporter 2 n=1 Tax=Ditylenchus dipsaci TaxID=166011 RepID=A0A915ENE3_9BILA